MFGRKKPIPFQPADDLVFHPDVSLPSSQRPDVHGDAWTMAPATRKRTTPVGGGFVVQEEETACQLSSEGRISLPDQLGPPTC